MNCRDGQGYTGHHRRLVRQDDRKAHLVSGDGEEYSLLQWMEDQYGSQDRRQGDFAY